MGMGHGGLRPKLQMETCSADDQNFFPGFQCVLSQNRNQILCWSWQWVRAGKVLVVVRQTALNVVEL
jgi:hypothetical protein